MTSIIALTLSAALSNAPAPPPPAGAPFDSAQGELLAFVQVDAEPDKGALLTQTARIISAPVAITEASAAPNSLRQGGDSLMNGAIIGGVVAGVASAVVLGYFCHIFNETGDPICVKQVAWRSAVAALGGAAIGAGIDAMIDHKQYAEHTRPASKRPQPLSGPAIGMRVRF
jgi:hypothetical protein